MAAGVLPRIGSALGPCTREDCGHRDCDETRRMARARCRLCSDMIGYGHRFYREDNGRLVHAACLEDEIQRERVGGE